MDKELLTVYADAIRARPLIGQLPAGVREYVQQFEKICLDDIRVQAGNPNLTEQEVLAMIEPTISKIIKDVLPLVTQIVLAVIKKHLPTAAMSGLVSAIATYLATK